jgi:hypothetical protein
MAVIAVVKYNPSDYKLRTRLSDSHKEVFGKEIIVERSGVQSITFKELYPVAGRIWHESWLYVVNQPYIKWPTIEWNRSDQFTNGNLVYIRTREEYASYMESIKAPITREACYSRYDEVMSGIFTARGDVHRDVKYGIPRLATYIEVMVREHESYISIRSYTWNSTVGTINHSGINAHYNMPFGVVDCSSTVFTRYLIGANSTARPFDNVVKVRLGETAPSGYRIPIDWRLSLGMEVTALKAQVEGIDGYFTSEGVFIPETAGFITEIPQVSAINTQENLLSVEV